MYFTFEVICFKYDFTLCLNHIRCFTGMWFFLSGSLAFYIGANDLVHEGTWVWVSSGHAITYNNWGPTQPNNRGGAENCAVITYAPQDGFVYHWTDEPCTNELTYICEMPYVYYSIMHLSYILLYPAN